MISETYTQSRLKLFLATIGPLAIATALGAVTLLSNNLAMKLGFGLPFVLMTTLLIYIVTFNLIKPNSIELHNDKIKLNILWRGKSEQFYWKDIADVAPDPGRDSNTILLKFKRRETYKKMNYRVPALWSGIDQDELVAKMNIFRMNNSGG